MSPLAMAEWIEIISIYLEDLSSGSPLAMAEWIEMGKARTDPLLGMSPLARAEWIEIHCFLHYYAKSLCLR